MDLDSCATPTLEWLCAAFRRGEMPDEYKQRTLDGAQSVTIVILTLRTRWVRQRSSALRRWINNFNKSGNSFNTISNQLTIPKSKLQSVIKKFKQFGITNYLLGCGRKPKLSLWTARKQCRKVNLNPRFVLKYITKSLDLMAIVIFWPSTQPKNTIPRWYTGRKWHIPMASNRKRSRGRIKAYDMGQGEGLIVPLQWCTGRE